MGDLNQDTLKDAKELQAFMEAHCNSTRYLFQVKNVGKNRASTVPNILFGFHMRNIKD